MGRESLAREDEYTYRLYVHMKERENFYKGDLLPFVNMVCRRDMTTGDIDSFMWDFNKKVLRIIESKKLGETQAESQHKFLAFLQTGFFEGYDLEVYKVIGNPPYDECSLFSFKNNIQVDFVKFEQLKKFINMELSFQDLQEGRLMSREEEAEKIKQDRLKQLKLERDGNTRGNQ